MYIMILRFYTELLPMGVLGYENSSGERYLNDLG